MRNDLILEVAGAVDAKEHDAEAKQRWGTCAMPSVRRRSDTGRSGEAFEPRPNAGR